MSQHFSSLGNVLMLRTTLADFSVEDRRAIFNALLLDTECNPGQKEMSPTERNEAISHFQRWGGWMQRESKPAPHLLTCHKCRHQQSRKGPCENCGAYESYVYL